MGAWPADAGAGALWLTSTRPMAFWMTDGAATPIRNAGQPPLIWLCAQADTMPPTMIPMA